MNYIKPIETNFRSRLKARWAVFFDTIGIEYKYKNEGYKIDGKYYRPDFEINESFIEIKPTFMTDEAYNKGRLLCDATKRDVYIIQGQPYPEIYTIDFFSSYSRFDVEARYEVPKYIQNCKFAQDRRCNCLWIIKKDIFPNGIIDEYWGYKLTHCKNCTRHDREPIEDGELIMRAYNNARQARF